MRRLALLLLSAALPACGGPDYERELRFIKDRTDDLKRRCDALADKADVANERDADLRGELDEMKTRHGQFELDLRRLRESSKVFQEVETEQERRARVNQFLGKFETPDPAEWDAVREGLVRGGAMAVRPLLQKFLDGEPLALVRVPEVLRAVVDPEAAPLLVEAMQHPEARRLAAEAIGNLGNARVVPFLVPHLQDKDANVRHSVAEALGKLGDLSGVPTLVQELESADERARLLAIDALEKITHETHGYRAYDRDSERRAAAVSRWKTWWTEKEKTLSASHPPAKVPPAPSPEEPGPPPSKGGGNGEGGGR
ncbi:MAG: HEAT repeat domain-containing protein [Planctomycetales bacterium]|nr:HEAT repeat domain-containing protein [Planctomycetales bacterium]